MDVFGLTEAEAKAGLRRMVVVGDRGPGQAGGAAGVSRCGPGDAAGGPVPRGAAAGVEGPGRVTRISPAGARTWSSWHAALAAGSAVTVQSVHGMGGVGKTQLATEYAYAHASDYDLVWWIAAEEPAAIPDQFAALAARLGLDPIADPEALRAQVHDQLRACRAGC